MSESEIERLRAEMQAMRESHLEIIQTLADRVEMLSARIGQVQTAILEKMLPQLEDSARKYKNQSERIDTIEERLM